MHLSSLLQKQGILTDEHITYVQNRIQTEAVSEEKALIDLGVPAETMRATLAKYYNLPAREIGPGIRVKNDVLQYLAEESARHYRMVPVDVRNETLVLIVEDPEMQGIRDVLNFITVNRGISYVLEVGLPSDVDQALTSYENIKGDVGEVLSGVEVIDTSLEKEIGKCDGSELGACDEDAPVTKIVSTILRYAIDGRASDIHIEPYEQILVVRFRVDGVLIRNLELPKRVHAPVVARIKILSQLRLDEKRKPQDGRFSTHIQNHKIDFRVSILPTNFGEKVVMRILDTEHGALSFDEIGISPHIAEQIRKALKKPNGVILLSGPTGSGKTTTLYAMLQEIDREHKNVISLEDPVEYIVEGISQSQVRPEIGYTFASGLRSILRQDPDVIMVGEIRDKETAQLAIQAALTGHLVFSTIHTNSAVGVVTRLIDMGVDPYLLAPTLQLAIAQRLVQRICPGSTKTVARTGAVAAMVDKQFADLPDEFLHNVPTSDTFIDAEPSAECPTGKKGRLAVLETLEITEEIKKIILEGGDEKRIYDSARARGFMTLREDAIVRALKHEISYDEIAILSGEDVIINDTEETIEIALPDEVSVSKETNTTDTVPTPPPATPGVTIETPPEIRH